MKLHKAAAFSCLLLAVLIALRPSCTCALAQDRSAASERGTQEEDIRAAVIRYQMLKWIGDIEKDEREAKNEADRQAAKKYDFQIFFISINDKDPSDAFVARFGDIPRRVKKDSQAVTDPSLSRRILDQETHQRGIVFGADAIRWRSHDSVDVEGGYYCGSLCASEETFKVRRQEGTWVVKKSRVKSVS
jgi:hypothetical protein